MTALPWGRHVWLVGMPGSGKSTIGPRLADLLGLAFVDLDDEVERLTGRPVRDIFARDGERAFREEEFVALQRVAEGPGAVIATGGGAVTAAENRAVMRRSGWVVRLDVDEEIALARIAGDDALRPLLRDGRAWKRLNDERLEDYVAVEDLPFRTGEGGRSVEPAAAADAIARSLTGDPEFRPDVVGVDAGGHAYDVVVGRGLIERVRMWLPPAPPGGRAFVIADPRVADAFGETVLQGAAEAGWAPIHLAVPEGEDAKTLAVAEALYRQLALREAQREDLIVGVGGGSTGDLAGFVAATYLRGVAIVLIPTTLLAMVDAAIGGKTAVNLPAGKNLVGAFHHPTRVIADASALGSLAEPQLRSGLGEVAKYALAFDRGLYGLLQREHARLTGPDLTTEFDLVRDVVLRCVGIKAEVVSRDERDAADRLLLNYGHTLGHALERLEGFHGRSHGEAVSIGMVFAARLAEHLGLGAAGLVERHVRLLDPLGLPTGGPLPPGHEVLAAMRMDKKRRGGLRFVLLEDVGRPTVVADVKDDTLVETLEAM
jgi:3-dehydroquinate synthase